MIAQRPTTRHAARPVADAPPGNWVDAYAPHAWRPYLRLARLDRPIGMWLLLYPCWWALALAQLSQGLPYPDIWQLALFAIGALVMRAAGCAWNDIIDRDYDARAARTASRPIPSGQVTVKAALIFAVALSFLGLFVLLQFNMFTIWLAIGSLALVAVYPFTKRFTYWPQIVLGLAFNWGALVGWAAAKGEVGVPALLLYAGAVLWTIGYDTIYAHQDRDDDLLLGLKSTAIKFGADTATWVGGFYTGAVVLWALAGFFGGAHLVFFFAVALASLQLSWQATTLDIADSANCLRRFRSNKDVGAVLFLGLVADMVLSWLASLA